MRFGVRKVDPLIVAPAPCFLCWYCSKQLPQTFTTVEKDGVHRRVHYECRAPAAELVRQVDFDRLPAA